MMIRQIASQKNSKLLKSLLAGLFGLLILSTAPTQALQVAFFNPGHANLDNPTGSFWPEASQFTQAVADDLGIKLETHYANRDLRLMRRQILSVLAREDKPDYLLLVNERFALNPLFEEINAAGIPFFLAYNHHSKSALAEQPHPRRHHRNWLGALVPDNQYAGYRLAQALMEAVAPEPPQLLAYSGDNVTSASRLRTAGLMQLLNETTEARLSSLVVGQWGYEIPRQRTSGLLARHPDTNIIWAANGPMAIGAYQGIADTAATSNVKIGSINWDKEEITALQNGEISRSLGGHFMTAGWSLIMLYDYHQGIDFADDGGSYQQRRIFEEVMADNLEQFLPWLLHRHWQPLDFRVMSKAENPALKHYQFTFSELLKRQPQ